MALAGKVQDAAWVGELIESNLHNSPEKVISNDDILWGACCAGLTAVALEMLGLGASANAEGYAEEGNTAVLQAAWSGDEVLVRALYNHGCEADVALLAACYLGLMDMIATLLDLDLEGVHVNMHSWCLGDQSIMERGKFSEEEDTPPLFIAWKRGHLQLMRYLMQRGAILEDENEQKLLLEELTEHGVEE
ncbi:hypothetical protein B484DRAFT_447256 [Ochromonadaceae sp. CCMP2298]|nr:hypothetical protein B484DRAFT_447256 [Ochromonadaceae sp. CCMP2298]